MCTPSISCTRGAARDKSSSSSSRFISISSLSLIWPAKLLVAPVDTSMDRVRTVVSALQRFPQKFLVERYILVNFDERLKAFHILCTFI